MNEEKRIIKKQKKIQTKHLKNNQNYKSDNNDFYNFYNNHDDSEPNNYIKYYYTHTYRDSYYNKLEHNKYIALYGFYYNNFCGAEKHIDEYNKCICNRYVNGIEIKTNVFNCWYYPYKNKNICKYNLHLLYITWLNNNKIFDSDICIYRNFNAPCKELNICCNRDKEELLKYKKTKDL